MRYGNFLASFLLLKGWTFSTKLWTAERQERRAWEIPKAIIRSEEEEVLSNAKGGGYADHGSQSTSNCRLQPDQTKSFHGSSPPSLDQYITNNLWRFKMRERNPNIIN